MDFEEIMRMMTPEVYANMKQAVELGKWPDGRRLTTEQRESSLQALIAYETRTAMPEEQRIGYLARKGCSSDKSIDETQTTVVQDLKSGGPA